VRAIGASFCHFIFYFSVDPGFRLVSDPFSNEKFIFIVVEVTALALPQIVNPVTLKVITVTFRKDTIAISLSLMPLPFINVFVSINHTALSLRHSIHPISVVTITIFIEKGTSAVLFVFKPVTCVLTT